MEKLYRKTTFASALVLATTLGAAFGIPAGYGFGSTVSAAQAAPPKASLPAVNPALLQTGNTSIADIAERALPSVVSVAATKVAPASGPRGGSLPFPFPFGFGGPQPPREAHGLGSGVIVSADGTILTNNHVVEGAQQIEVMLSNKRKVAAEVVGTDPQSDLAVLRLKEKVSDLVPIPIGLSSNLRLGEVVLAIGNPFGVGETVTMGIVSAKGRADVGITAYEDFIQTDAAINPGNSGGALVNMRGELVGINTAILSRSGGNMGIGFAIPTDMAKPISESLLKHGKVDRGYLGVSIQDVDQELAKAMQLPSAQGVLVSDVQANSPAAKGGLVRGDVVVRVDGKAVNTTGQLRNAIAAAGAGKKVKLDVLRDGKPRSISVTLGELPSEPGSRSRPGAPAGGSSLDGLSLRDLDGQLRGQLGVPDSVKGGVAVTNVQPGSAAEKAGLRPGDVLLEVDRQPVATVSNFRKLWAKSKGKTLLLVQRQGSTMFLVVQR